jgi:4'-phosphopantetheinyl transferase
MIYVFYHRAAGKLTGATFNALFAGMPHPVQEKILKFRNWQDAQHSLLGKVLLIHAVKGLGMDYSLTHLKYSVYARPYFNNNIDFNISHSGEYTICAISTNHKLGIDVEEIKPFNIEDLKYPFSPEEWNNINEGDAVANFYLQWTKKEAFIKAVGVGLNTPLYKLSLTGSSFAWQNKNWFLFNLPLDEKHACHLCADKATPKIMLEKVDFE